MKRPTLKQLIETGEKEVNPEDWYRQKLLLNVFHGMSAATLNNYCKEMMSIPEFSEGIMKPGHSTTFVNLNMFIWYLRWKEANNYRVNKLSPCEVLESV